MSHKYPPNQVRDFLDKNPKGTYTDFVLKTGSKMVPSNFSYIRRKYREEKSGTLPSKKTEAIEKRAYTRRKSPVKVYSRLWFISVEKLLQDPKAALLDLVNELCRSGRINCEMIELTTPHDIEVREITKN